jgi:hypothetical protein
MEAEPQSPLQEARQEETGEEAAAATVKKPRKVAKPKAAVRMRVVWGVFSSSVQCVQTFPYPQKREAETLAAKLTAEKKSPYFVQPIKEPISEESSAD